MTSFFEEETLHEKTSVGWLIGILLSLSAFFVCVYFRLHYRLISISQTILNFLLFILLSGGSLLIFFLTSRHQKKKSESIFDFTSDFFSHSNSSSNSDFSSDFDFSSDSSFSSNPGSSNSSFSNSGFSSDFEASMPPTPPLQSPAYSSDTVLLQPDTSAQTPSASLTVFENGQPLTVYLTEEFLLIGKHPELANLCLSIPTVSRLHARIRKDAACFFIMDLNSKNGTFINGKPLSPQEEYPLCDNDKIQISEVELIFHNPQINLNKR